MKYYFDYECNEPLIANAKLTATSSLRDRGPENAKLYGKFIKKLLNVFAVGYPLEGVITLIDAESPWTEQIKLKLKYFLTSLSQFCIDKCDDSLTRKSA